MYLALHPVSGGFGYLPHNPQRNEAGLDIGWVIDCINDVFMNKTIKHEAALLCNTTCKVLSFFKRLSEIDSLRKY